MRGRAVAALIAGVLLAAGALMTAGCGGSDDADTTAASGSDTAASTTAGDETTAGERKQLKSHDDSGGGAAQFENARTAGTVVEFGAEADTEDFEAVAAAMHGYLDAKEAQDWELSCEYMAVEAIESVAQFDPSASVEDCPAVLEQFSSGTAPEILSRLAEADVGSVRIQGDRAHALYHGARDFGFYMPMVFEDGLWKVRSLAPSILP